MYFVGNKAKGQPQNGCFKKTKHGKFSEKRLFLTPERCAYQGVRNVRFLENLACFIFLKHPFWDSPIQESWQHKGESVKSSHFMIFNCNSFPKVLKEIILENSKRDVFAFVIIFLCGLQQLEKFQQILKHFIVTQICTFWFLSY